MIYLAFIGLGLPDSLLGAAWPAMYVEFGVPVSCAGIASTIIAAGTVVSSLCSDRLTRRFGTGKLTTFSVALTAVALLGFSVSHSFWLACLWAIPYGLGAGSVDASLNNYVALHYASRHMSWLHCMWGVGASVGPWIMGQMLAGGRAWNAGYFAVGAVQVLLTAGLLAGAPLWKANPVAPNRTEDGAVPEKALTLRQILRIPGAREVMITFFCYCAVEQTVGLWAGSYLVLNKDLHAETAARLSGLFFIGITAGRALGGFLTMRLRDRQMIVLGQAIVAAGIVLLLLPGRAFPARLGLTLIGLGCAPIYPCIIHSTPEYFGADKSQAIIGVEMACAYAGNCLMPPLFGAIANSMGVALLPAYLLALLAGMALMHRMLLRKVRLGG